MDYETIELEREKLYEEVWQTSINQLASKYGISNVGLAKICRKLNVPTPPRGYWARVEHGYKVERVMWFKRNGHRVKSSHQRREVARLSIPNNPSFVWPIAIHSNDIRCLKNWHNVVDTTYVIVVVSTGLA